MGILFYSRADVTSKLSQVPDYGIFSGFCVGSREEWASLIPTALGYLNLGTYVHCKFRAEGFQLLSIVIHCQITV